MITVLLSCGKPAAEGPPAPMGESPLFGDLRLETKKGEISLRLDRAPGKPEPAFLGVLVNDAASGVKACYVLVEVATGVPRLVNDNGSGSTTAGPDGRLRNGQCTVEAGPVERSKRTVAVRLRVTGQLGFAGTKQVFTIALDGNGQGTELTPAATWSVD